MPQKKLRYAFIGAGGIAGAHMRDLARRDDVEMVAMADIAQASMARHRDRFGIERMYSDWNEMLDAEDIDAVSICTPNKLHEAPTIDALNAGCHVLCEKPLAHSAEAGERMVAAARDCGRKLCIAFQYRYNPRTQFLRRAYDDGEFGNVLYARVRALRRRGIPNWGVFGRKDLQGGGPLIDIGVHALEMTHYAMGSPQPVSATADMFTYIGDKPSDRVESAWKGWDHKTYTVEDLAVGRIRFANGAVAHIEAAFAAHIEKDDWNFELMGDEGGASWNPPRIFTDEHGHMVDKSPGWLANAAFDNMFTRKMNNFVDHCLYDKPTLAPGEDGLAVQRMLDGLYRSAENGGREVDLGDAL
ncbi:MAG: Gfo/Idh/MocA family oxidoreductase [Gammaproteobacteria bacterium]|nr:Gfo/Idh/MocA family oxidoreductase [Gammaproteobacteria bacterium]MDE0443166.1 Gfo/Idh/MocA family oxidoreductase [Gammaproteobacteria bacterium]